MSRCLEWTVPPEAAGVRVDTLLKRHLGLSGTVVRRIKWLPDGILADGVRVNTRYVPRPGQVLSVRLSDPDRRSGVVPAPGALDIVYDDGDLVVVRQCPSVENGAIAVALVGDEATVKRFYREDGHYRLQPQNSSMEPIIVDEVKILGKVIGVFRMIK